MSQLGSLQMGKYRPLRSIGRGGQGRVYEGRIDYSRSLQRPCAIKVLRDDQQDDPEALKLFIREAAIGLELSHDHPNLVTTRDFGETGDGQLFLITEYVDGPALAEIATDLVGRYALIRPIAADVLCGLDYLHENGVIHCDVSPGNILITRDGIAKLGDLGMVRRAESSRRGQLRGVAAYASPEELGMGEVTPASDLYSLGALLYELVQGTPPYGRGTFRSVQHRMMAGPTEPLPETTPPDLVQLVDGLLHRDPDQRLPADEALEMIGTIGDGAEGESDEDLAVFVADWIACHSTSRGDRPDKTMVALSAAVDRIAPKAAGAADLRCGPTLDRSERPPGQHLIEDETDERESGDPTAMSEQVTDRWHPLEPKRAADRAERTGEYHGVPADQVDQADQPDVRIASPPRHRWPPWLLVLAAAVVTFSIYDVWQESEQPAPGTVDAPSLPDQPLPRPVAAGSQTEPPASTALVLPGVEPSSRASDEPVSATPAPGNARRSKHRTRRKPRTEHPRSIAARRSRLGAEVPHVAKSRFEVFSAESPATNPPHQSQD